MLIKRIDIFRISVPFETGGPRHGLRSGLAAWTEMESLMVRVTTQDDCIGWGEAFGHSANPGTYSLLESLVAPWFIGKDSGSIAALMEGAHRAFFGFGRNGPVKYALSAIDIALWDIAGQRAGRPLFQLLGGASPRVDLYASLMRYSDQEAVAKNVSEACKRGFRLMKLHESEIANFQAARDAANGAGISLDVNCPWTVAQAAEMVDAIAPYGFAWLEEPIWPPEDYESLARLRNRGVPIAAGENIGTLHDFRRVFEAGAVDIIQPSIVKVGGISAMLEILTLAKAFAVRAVPHCFVWGPGYLATAHVVAAQAVPPPLETPFITLQDAIHPAFDPRQGHVVLSDTRPGLGFDPDLALMSKYTVAQTLVGT